jgi:aubergine-like protein
LVYSIGKGKVKKEVNGKVKMIRERVYHVPEFLLATGLTEKEKNNGQVMNALAKETRLEPQERQDRIKDMAKMLHRANDELGLELNLGANKYEARLLDPPTIKFKDGKCSPKGGTFQIGKTPSKFNSVGDWMVITSNFSMAKKMVGMIQDKGWKFHGVDFPDPMFFDLPRDISKGKMGQRISSMGSVMMNSLKRFKNKFNGGRPSIVMFMADQRFLNWAYPEIKSRLGGKSGLLTQVVVAHPSRLKGAIADKISVQIATKVGITPWVVQVPQPFPKSPNKKHPVMLVGADVYHKKGSASVASVVGTINDDFTKTCSFSNFQEKAGKEVISTIWDHVLNCIKRYMLSNDNRLPETLIFYRDGVGSGQLDIILREEVSKIERGLKEKFGKNKPGLVFIVATKRLSDRFFEDGRLGKLSNPRNGLIVHSSESSVASLDFFMVAQKVTQGTATPTRYQVIFNNSELTEPEYFFQLTYFQTHNYYNWGGAVRVPGVCQCAHTLAYQAGESIKKQMDVNVKLIDTQHYL